MKISKGVCLLVSLTALLLLNWGSTAHSERPHSDSRPILLGVSLAGPEFGVERSTFSNAAPGRYGQDYTFPRADTVEYFSKAGVDLIRLPFRWERIQPKLNGELDKKYLDRIKKVTRTALENNAFVILDLHNYGRYHKQVDGMPCECVIDQSVHGEVHVSRHHFADLWKRLALEFRGANSVVGYGLMNEPHDMGSSNWKEISQLAVDVIRKIDRETAIVVSGDEWASAERFAEINGDKPWIRDPANHVVYEAHCYFDQDGSGKYSQSYDAELTTDQDLSQRGAERVAPFLNWCRRNRVRGLIGEFGTPDDSRWGKVTLGFLKACQEAQVGVCYWAAGEWWGDYPLSIQPRDNGVASQLRWLQSTKNRKKLSNR